MSLNKSATRRLGLLAGASLIAAGLGVLAMPATAFAANECAPVGVDPTVNGATADVYTCAAGTYASGITYNSAGVLSVSMVANGAVVNSTLTANGVTLTATGTDSVTFNSAVGTLTGGAGTAGPVVDVSSVSGAISITTNGVTGNTAGTTHAIRATSTGGGAITITRTVGAVNNTVAGGVASIEAVTNGGAISITTAGGTNGRARGILAQTSGTGAVTLAIGGAVSASTVDGVAGIDAIAGTGAIGMTITSGAVSGGTGPAIRAATGATSATAAVNIQNTGGTVSGRVDFSGVTAGGVTFNNTGVTTGQWTASGASVFSGQNDTLTLGGGATHTAAAGTSFNFAGGNDTWTLSGLLSATTTTADFGAGTDAFNVSGRLAMNGLTLSNLEAFNLSGVIYMGGTNGTATDGAANDVLRLTSGTFTGSGSARVIMDVTTGVGAQEGCATLTLSDCLDLRGATTAGVTVLTLNELNTNTADGGGYVPAGITLVDVGGGTSAAGHFVLDPATPGYVTDRTVGDVLSRGGLFVYALQYDAANQRHVLVGLPASQTMEYAMLSGAAQSIWHMTAETVTDRQTDLRGGAQGGGAWLRTSGQYDKRTVSTPLSSFGQTLAFDNSYTLYAGSVTGGFDLIMGSRDGYDYVAGVQLGYVGSSFDLDRSTTSGRFTGATGGVYASAWSERFFLDGTLNANVLTLDYTTDATASQTNTYLSAIGAKAEGGMRLALGENSFAEPMATLAYVRTSFEEISLDGAVVRPADARSVRGAIGLRLGTQLTGQGVNVSYFAAGRAWSEFQGESRGVVANPGTELAFTDDFGGGFGEAEIGVSLNNAANTLSGFLTSGVKFKDAYSATNVSLGVRIAW